MWAFSFRVNSNASFHVLGFRVMCMVEQQFTESASVHATATAQHSVRSLKRSGATTRGSCKTSRTSPSPDVETAIGQGNVLTPLLKRRVVRAWRALLKHAGMVQPGLGAAMPFVAPAPSKVAQVLSQLVSPSQPPQHMLMPPEETQPSMPALPPGTLYPSHESRTMALQGSHAVPVSHPTTETHSKRKFSSVLAPGDDRKFPLLPLKKAAQVRGGFHTEEWWEVTGEQLSVLAARLAVGAFRQEGPQGSQPAPTQVLESSVQDAQVRRIFGVTVRRSRRGCPSGLRQLPALVGSQLYGRGCHAHGALGNRACTDCSPS